LEDLGHGHYRVTREGLTAGTYVVDATAKDKRGHEGRGEARFTLGEQALVVELPDGATLDQRTDAVVVESPVEKCRTRKGVAAGGYPCVRTVRLDLVAGGSVNLTYDDELGAWKATSNNVGWRVGDDNAFTVTAELVDRYHGSIRVPGGDLTTTQTLNVTVPEGPTADPRVAKVPRDPGVPQRSTPGAEVGLLAVGLLAVAFLVRRRA
jgi:hypothetical protein